MVVIFPNVMTQKSSRSQMNIRKGRNVVWWTPLESFNGVPPNSIESIRTIKITKVLVVNIILRQMQDAWNMPGFYSHETKSSIQVWMTWNIPHSSSTNDFKILLLRGLLGSGTDNYQHHTPYKPLVHLHYLRPPTFLWAKKCLRQNSKNRGLLAC